MKNGIDGEIKAATSDGLQVVGFVEQSATALHTPCRRPGQILISFQFLKRRSATQTRLGDPASPGKAHCLSGFTCTFAGLETSQGFDELAHIVRSETTAYELHVVIGALSDPHATRALQADQRWSGADTPLTADEESSLAARIRLATDDLELSPEILRRIAAQRQCLPQSKCVLLRLDQHRLLLVSAAEGQQGVSSTVIDLDRPASVAPVPPGPRAPRSVALDSATIELRRVERRQLYVDGAAVGEPFE